MAWIDFWDRHLRLDGIEEADELLVPVALHVSADNGAVEHVESSEQRGRTVTFVVVGHRSSTPRATTFSASWGSAKIYPLMIPI
jgi:hypothetical protein